MAAYDADNAATTAGATATKRTGTASADTIPAGTVVLWINNGAGTHVVTLTNNATHDGLAVTNRTISLPAGTAKWERINSLWGDANGRVAVAIDGTAGEVVYYIGGGI